jgi:hypothetical protein
MPKSHPSSLPGHNPRASRIRPDVTCDARLDSTAVPQKCLSTVCSGLLSVILGGVSLLALLMLLIIPPLLTRP